MISVGMNYYTDNRANEQPGMGRIARYAWGKDYHKVMSQRLAQLEAKIATLAPGITTKAYVDTGPIMEKAWAQQAGLGWVGKHSNPVPGERGSWPPLGGVSHTPARAVLPTQSENPCPNPHLFFEINEAFHMQLLVIANNRWRDQMVADLRKVMKLNRHNSLLKSGRIEESLAEHKAIMQALSSRNAKAAMQRMREHFANGLEAAT